MGLELLFLAVFGYLAYRYVESGRALDAAKDTGTGTGDAPIKPPLAPADVDSVPPPPKTEITMYLDAAPRALPPGSYIRETAGGADMPLENGERVVFNVEGPDHAANLEGVYEAVVGGAFVTVDREADVQKGTLPFGRYAIPASTKSTYHSFVERAAWYALDPTSVGLKTFPTQPNIDPGDKITVAVRDQHGNQAVAIAIVETVDDATGKMVVLLSRVYRVLVDEGRGPMRFSQVIAQARIPMTNAQLVDPKSLG